MFSFIYVFILISAFKWKRFTSLKRETKPDFLSQIQFKFQVDSALS